MPKVVTRRLVKRTVKILSKTTLTSAAYALDGKRRTLTKVLASTLCSQASASHQLHLETLK